MKRFVLFVLVLSVSIASKAQLMVDSSFQFDKGNDTTQFALAPITVVDTSQVLNAVKEYRLKKTAEYNDIIKDIEKDNAVIISIIEKGEKGLLSQEDGTYDAYNSLYQELIGDSQRAVEFRNSSEQQTKKYGQFKPQSWNEIFDKESKNIERLMTKQNKISPLIIPFAGFVVRKNRKQIEYYEYQVLLVENDANNATIESDFREYYKISKTRVLPKRETLKRINNPYYIKPPGYVSTYGKAYWEVERALDERDLYHQTLHWNWIDGYSYENINSKYPYEYTAKRYYIHPEYQVLYEYNIYDNDGNLVRIKSLSRHTNCIDDIARYLTNLQYQKDYLNNKYDILSEGPDVQYAVANRLGLSTEYAESLVDFFIDGSVHDLGTKYGTIRQRVDSYKKLQQDYVKFASEWVRLLNDKAIRFCEQLVLDHEKDFKYILKAERLSPLSFKITYCTENFKPTSSVIVEFYAPTPFVYAKWKIIDFKEL